MLCMSYNIHMRKSKIIMYNSTKCTHILVYVCVYIYIYICVCVYQPTSTNQTEATVWWPNNAKSCGVLRFPQWTGCHVCSCGETTWQWRKKKQLHPEHVTWHLKFELQNWFCSGYDGFFTCSNVEFTLWWTYKKLLKMAIEIVDFPIKNGDVPLIC